jgi:hypothetical protein
MVLSRMRRLTGWKSSSSSSSSSTARRRLVITGRQQRVASQTTSGATRHIGRRGLVVGHTSNTQTGLALSFAPPHVLPAVHRVAGGVVSVSVDGDGYTNRDTATRTWARDEPRDTRRGAGRVRGRQNHQPLRQRRPPRLSGRWGPARLVLSPLLVARREIPICLGNPWREGLSGSRLIPRFTAERRRLPMGRWYRCANARVSFHPP